jgi:hypothetical protein
MLGWKVGGIFIQRGVALDRDVFTPDSAVKPRALGRGANLETNTVGSKRSSRLSRSKRFERFELFERIELL